MKKRDATKILVLYKLHTYENVNPRMRILLCHFFTLIKAFVHYRLCNTPTNV